MWFNSTRIMCIIVLLCVLFCLLFSIIRLLFWLFFPLNIPEAAAKKLTSRLRMLLGKEKTASGHIMYGAHACLVPVNSNWIYGSEPRWSLSICLSLLLTLLQLCSLSSLILLYLDRFGVILCIPWLAAVASVKDSMPLIIEESGLVMQESWATMPSSLCCPTNLHGFCMSFMIFDLRASTLVVYIMESWRGDL